jgi:hypothetical protein
MKQDAFIKEVAQHIVNKRLVPFVGAGLSCTAGYPSWKKLIDAVFVKSKNTEGNKIDKIRQEIEEKIGQGLYQEAADIFAIKIENYPNLVCDEIKAVEKSERVLKMAKRVTIDKWLCDTIITTNYDGFMEKIHDQQEKSIVFNTNLDRVFVPSEETKIIHLHGSIQDPKSIVFSSDDISRQIWTRNLVSDYLKAIFLLKFILFIGYGIKDWHIERTLKEFQAVRKDANINHYAILTATEEQVEIWEKIYHLRILRLDSSKGYKTENGNDLIEIISQVTAECDRLRKKDMKVMNNSSEAVSDTIKKLANLASLQHINLPIESLLDLIVKKGLEAIDKNRKTFTIHLVEGEEMRVIASGGENITRRNNDYNVRSSKSGLTGKVYIEKLKNYYASDVHSDVSKASGYLPANETTNSEFILPLKDRDNSYFGILNFESSEQNDFDEEETREVLDCVSQHISIALQNKKIYDLKNTALEICTEIFGEQVIDYNSYSNNQFKDSFEQLIKTINERFSYFTGNSFSASLFSHSRNNDDVTQIATTDSANNTNKFSEDMINRATSSESFISNNIEIYWHLKEIKDENDYFLYLCFVKPNIDKISDEFIAVLEVSKNRLAKHLQFIQQTQQTSKVKKELSLFKEIIELPENIDKLRFLNRVAELCCKYLGVDWCFIYTHDVYAKYLKQREYDYKLTAMKFARGDVDFEEFSTTTYSPGDGLTGLVIKSRDFVHSEDFFTDPRSTGKNLQLFRTRGINRASFLGYPIKDLIYNSKHTTEDYGDILGAITFGKMNNHFDLEDRNMVKNISILIGNRLKSRQLMNSHNNFKSYISLLEELPLSLIKCKNEDEILNTFHEFIPKYLDEQYYSIFKLNDENVLEMVSPKEYLELSPPTFKHNEGLTGRIIDNGHIFELNLHDEGHPDCKRFWTQIIGTDDRYFIGVPIKSLEEDKFYGVITLNGRKPETFDPVFYEEITLEVMKSIAHQITLALGNLREHSQ